MNKESDTIMRYFIDFEATQFTNEIISIGCVKETGETFYSLVKVDKNKMTNFITNLTGITKEDIEKAPTADEVFDNFYDWIAADNEKAIFYCYGNSDLTFILKNLNNSGTLKSQISLSLLRSNLIDYSKRVINHFGLIKSIALKKVVAYYRGVEEIEQNHNSLEDALFLKEIYEHINKEEEVVSCPFPEYSSDNCKEIDELNFKILSLKRQIFFNNNDFKLAIFKSKKGKLLKDFQNKEEAFQFVLKTIGTKNAAEAKEENIYEKIYKSCSCGKSYCGFFWRVIETDN